MDNRRFCSSLRSYDTAKNWSPHTLGMQTGSNQAARGNRQKTAGNSNKEAAAAPMHPN